MGETDELQGIRDKLDKIIEGQTSLMVGMTKIEGELKSLSEKSEDRFKRIEQDIEDGKKSRERIHERVDKTELRLKTMEDNPIWSDWDALKKRLYGVLWKAGGIILAGILLASLPKIIEQIRLAVSGG